MSQTSELQRIVKAPSSVTRFWIIWTAAVSLGATWAGVTQVQISQLTDNQAKIQVENTKLQSIVHGLLTTVEIIIVQTKLHQEYNKQQILDVNKDLSGLEMRVNALNKRI